MHMATLIIPIFPLPFSSPYILIPVARIILLSFILYTCYNTDLSLDFHIVLMADSQSLCSPGLWGNLQPVRAPVSSPYVRAPHSNFASYALETFKFNSCN